MTDLSKVSTDELNKELLRRQEEQRLRMRISLLEKDGVKWLETNLSAIAGNTRVIDEVTLVVKDGRLQVTSGNTTVDDIFKSMETMMTSVFGGIK